MTGCRELRDIPSLYAAYTAGISEGKKTSGVVVPCLCDEAEYLFSACETVTLRAD
jgi:hypothetical protein